MLSKMTNPKPDINKSREAALKRLPANQMYVCIWHSKCAGKGSGRAYSRGAGKDARDRVSRLHGREPGVVVNQLSLCHPKRRFEIVCRVRQAVSLRCQAVPLCRRQD